MDTPGWKSLKHIAARHKLFKQMVKQSKAKSKCRAIRFKFGVQVPRDFNEALKLDAENGNNLWKEAID